MSLSLLLEVERRTSSSFWWLRLKKFLFLFSLWVIVGVSNEVWVSIKLSAHLIGFREYLGASGSCFGTSARVSRGTVEYLSKLPGERFGTTAFLIVRLSDFLGTLYVNEISSMCILALFLLVWAGCLLSSMIVNYTWPLKLLLLFSFEEDLNS